MRLVLDTNVLVAALRNGSGASNALLSAAVERAFVWLASPALYLEYQDVLLRSEQMEAAGWHRREADMFLATIAGLVAPVAMHYRWRPLSSDPADEMVLDTAINGRADLLVSFNSADLVAVRRFGIDLVRPAEALWRVRHDRR